MLLMQAYKVKKEHIMPKARVKINDYNYNLILGEVTFFSLLSAYFNLDFPLI